MNILSFFAHPDDETMLIGGTLALLAKAGHTVHYLVATRGEGGETGDPPLCSREDLGDVREQELVCAVQALGGRSLTFLGYVDPTVGEGNELYAYTKDLTMLSGQVVASIRQFAVDVLITHGSNGEYGHPAHQLTYQAARIAVESLAKDNSGIQQPYLYTVAAIFPEHPRPHLANKDDSADLVIDVTPALEQKTKAAMCHRTQHALFTRRASQEAGRQLTVPEVIISLESLHRVIPPWIGSVSDPLAQVLQPWLWQSSTLSSNNPS